MTYNSLRFVVLLVIVSVLGFLVLSVKANAWDSTNRESIKDYAIHVAQREKINVGAFLATLECEAGFQNIQSRIVKNGVREQSFGVAQIHLPSHPHITKEQALSPFWAINWMAEEWLNGRESKWSCFRTMGLSYLKRSEVNS